jgi:adenosylhomocysteinase
MKSSRFLNISHETVSNQSCLRHLFGFYNIFQEHLSEGRYEMSDAPGDILDAGLAAAGRERIDWAWREMPVLRSLHRTFSSQRPLEGLRISVCLHITTETANLARTLKIAGADLVLCASNPLSTQDDVAATLVRDFSIPVYAIRGEDTGTYYQHIQSALNHRPRITLDDGADLVSQLHMHRPEGLAEIIGGTEETAAGVIRLRAMAKSGALKYPIVAVNDAFTKHLFDNRYGTGQSTIDGILRATNVLVAGKVFAVVAYGWCGRGIAMRAHGLGANVIVAEVQPLRALEAAMDGFRVMPLVEAVAIADIVITATGNKHVVDREHLEVMKDGCIMANSGHFDVEVNIPALAAMSKRTRRPRPFVEEFHLADGRILCLLANGRLVNLAAAEGHPAAVMDMSFANQALAVVYLAKEGHHLDPQVYPVPALIDEKVARLKLTAMGLSIDTLTAAQEKYLLSWQEGTA